MRRRAWLVLPVLLVGALVLAVYTLRIEQVSVTGVRTLSPRVIVEASGLEPGERILWERLSEAERRVERIPAVAAATAERSLPSTVVIHVRERAPLARLDGARNLVVDDEGVVFLSADVAVQPVLYGWRGPRREGATVDERSRAVLAALPRFPEVLRVRARKIRVGHMFVLTLAGGMEVRFGGINDLEIKARAAEAVMRAERGGKLAYIDVRSPTVPVSKEKATPAPPPAATLTPVPVAPRPASTPPPTSTPSSTGRPHPQR